MSLYFDQLLSEVQDKNLAQALRQAMIVRAENVAEYHFQRSAKEKWFNDDFKNVAPPADYLWFEWRWPEWTNSEGKRLPFTPELIGRKAGVLVVSFKGPYATKINEETLSVDKSEWFCQGSLFTDINDGQFVPQECCGVCMWKVGPMGELRDFVPGMRAIMPGFSISSELLQSKEYQNFVQSGMYVPWLAMSFMNCKNVKVEKSPPISPALHRARLARGLSPLHRFHVLKIGLPPTNRRGSVYRGGQTEKALHIVRGHFKTFDAQKPLFGKLTGTWWWPMHRAGAAERGVVEKQYEVRGGEHGKDR